MPLIAENRKFDTVFDNDRTLLLANANVLVEETVRLDFNFDFKSTNDDLVQIVSLTQLKRLNESWNNTGLVSGDSIYLECFLIDESGATPKIDTITQAVTITSIQGNLLNLTPAILTNSGNVTINPTGLLTPQQKISSSLFITNYSRTTPKEIEFTHNLIPNSVNNSYGSIIDGENNVFMADFVHGMTIGQTKPLVQQGEKSGGRYVDGASNIKRVSDSGSFKRFEVTMLYILPSTNGIDFTQPDFYLGDKCLKSTFKVKGYPDISNPNNSLSLVSYDPIGNTGGVDEEYNGGVSVYSIDSLTIKNPIGDIIQSLDHKVKNTIEAVIKSTESISGQVDLVIEMIVPDDDYRNNQWTNLQNTYLSYKVVGGASIQSEKLGRKFVIDADSQAFGTNEVTLKFDIQANSELLNYIESLQSQQRLYRITAAVERSSGQSGAKDVVTVNLKQGIFEASPIPDEPFNGVFEKGFLNHSQDIGGVSKLNYNGTTEDDVLFYSKMNIDNNVKYESLLLKVQVERISDGQVFDLLSDQLNLSSVINVNGVNQYNESKNLIQYLDAPNKNKIEFKNTGVSTGSTYETELIWSILIDWRYWEQNSNAFNDFYDISLPHNGKNSEWVRYLQLSGFKIIAKASLVKDGIAYYIDGELKVDDYDASTVVTTTQEYYDENNNLQPVLIDNQLMKIRAIHTLSNGTFDINDVWGWIAFRNYESDPRKEISTEWNWTNKNLPLKPKQGQNKATLTLFAPNVLLVECLIDTSLVNVSNFSIISRIQSPKV